MKWMPAALVLIGALLFIASCGVDPVKDRAACEHWETMKDDPASWFGLSLRAGMVEEVAATAATSTHLIKNLIDDVYWASQRTDIIDEWSTIGALNKACDKVLADP